MSMFRSFMSLVIDVNVLVGTVFRSSMHPGQLIVFAEAPSPIGRMKLAFQPVPFFSPLTSCSIGAYSQVTGVMLRVRCWTLQKIRKLPVT